jgi:glutamyl-tRNA synthetase
MPIAEIVRLFDLPGVNQSNARFDDKKLAHMNMAYLLELPAEKFLAKAREFFATQARAEDAVTAARAKAALAADEAFFRKVMLLSQPKIKGFEELPAYTAYFFTEEFAVDEKVRAKVLSKGDPKARLRELSEAVADGQINFASDTAVEEGIKALAAKGGFGFGDYQSVARLALSGTNVGPSITGMMRVLGKDKVFARFERLLAS